ncbi:hypothetical protein BST81_06495 [Leptolyngbya sp. 'hensonii']|uniref:hypothetical protein n=1 Tax=Leptolyngbya sp. 'hensonii' TaxID=1922337 RepID=UPI00094F5E77|nr:hypothetical protein [Leptolyngbya sp. 'hensonii']OLP19389.1 hypothetical protein BST81_06495 [Leptolyngbya sp. 'hensonii']
MSQQSKELYIFVTSDRPDLYINIIGYCIKHFNIAKIILLGIVKDRGQKSKNEKDLLVVKDRIKEQLECLQRSEYLYFNQQTKKWDKKEISLEKHEQLRYLEISEKRIDIQCIIYDHLDDELDNFINGDCIFDLSGVLKEYLIDVYILLLKKQVKDVYVFELRLPQRLYNERELIHNLFLDRGDYSYIPITASQYTAGTIVKTESQEKADQARIDATQKLLNILAGDFARNVLVIYAILFLFVVIWTTRLIIQDGWGKLEPWTFLLFVLLPYLINLVVMIFFKKEYSLKPSYLYEVMRNYRLKMLNKQWLI